MHNPNDNHVIKSTVRGQIIQEQFLEIGPAHAETGPSPYYFLDWRPSLSGSQSQPLPQAASHRLN